MKKKKKKRIIPNIKLTEHLHFIGAIGQPIPRRITYQRLKEKCLGPEPFISINWDWVIRSIQSRGRSRSIAQVTKPPRRKSRGR